MWQFEIWLAFFALVVVRGDPPRDYESCKALAELHPLSCTTRPLAKLRTRRGIVIKITSQISFLG